MKNPLDSDDRQFLACLNRLGGGTVQELCAELGVTATAVRQRLNRLEGHGIVERETVRNGRGRPHHHYRVTESGLRDMGDNYSDLAQILWTELRLIEDPVVRHRILDRIEQSLVQRYGTAVQGRSLVERLERLCEALTGRGFHVEIDSSGELPILRENHCPYLDLAETDPTICELEQQVFRRVLGTDLRLTQCCLDGHTCCEFAPSGA